MDVGRFRRLLACRCTRDQTNRGERIGLVPCSSAGDSPYHICSSAFAVPANGLAGRRFAPETAIGRGAGLTLTAAGLLLCIWARRTLGDYWSDKVALRVDHQLIRRGAYAH